MGKITHYRIVDTGRTSNVLTGEYPGARREVSVFALEVQKGKKWEPVKDSTGSGGLAYGYGWEQAIDNLRYYIHHRKSPVHAYQIEGVDELPVIAVPEGYEIERLVHKGSKSWENPSYYLPTRNTSPFGPFDGEDGSVMAFNTYSEALRFLRKQARQQEYSYDDCRYTI